MTKASNFGPIFNITRNQFPLSQTHSTSTHFADSLLSVLEDVLWVEVQAQVAHGRSVRARRVGRGARAARRLHEEHALAAVVTARATPGRGGGRRGEGQTSGGQRAAAVARQRGRGRALALSPQRQRREECVRPLCIGCDAAVARR